MIPMDNYVIHNYSEDDVSQGVDGMEAEERRVMVERAIERLSGEDNLLITLFYKGESSIEEISDITGLSSSNVKVRLHRIRKRLYEELSAAMKDRVE